MYTWNTISTSLPLSQASPPFKFCIIRFVSLFFATMRFTTINTLLSCTWFKVTKSMKGCIEGSVSTIQITQTLMATKRLYVVLCSCMSFIINWRGTKWNYINHEIYSTMLSNKHSRLSFLTPDESKTITIPVKYTSGSPKVTDFGKIINIITIKHLFE